MAISSFFGHRRRQSTRRPAFVQACETRILLAGLTTKFQSNTLTVSGTKESESITVSVQGGTVQIEYNGKLCDTMIDVGKVKTVMIRGLGGDDVLTVDKSLESLNCQLFGMDGDDILEAYNSGSNILRGGCGSDSYVGGFGNDALIVDEADALDSIQDQGGSFDSLNAATAKKGITCQGIVGFEYFKGSEFDDSIDLSNSTDGVKFLGMGGDDTFYSGSGNDIIYGGNGNDMLFAGAGDDLLNGGDGEDLIDGQEGSNTVHYGNSPQGVYVNLADGVAEDGFGFKDQLKNLINICGSKFNDRLYGDSQSNQIFGLNGDDQIYGDDGADSLFGGNGDDWIVGGRGEDTLRGDAGNDVLIGGIDQSTPDSDLDWLFGGTGKDTSYGAEKTKFDSIETVL